MKAKDYNLSDSLGHHINALSVEMKKLLDIKLKNYNVTVHQFGILLLISKRISLTQKEIAENTNGDEPATARLMNRLEDKRYIKRNLDKVDKRKKLISLTKEGELLLNKILPLAQEINSTLTSPLNEKEKETLLYLLKKIHP